MLALCVDDEALLLAELVRAVEESPDITETVSFKLSSEALSWAENNRPDIALLDMRLRGGTGIELAEKLFKLYPDLPVVFCTGYREYAYDAFQIHAAGYITKPIKYADVQKEIDIIKSKSASAEKTDKLLTVQCFGNFEAFCNGKPLNFKRKRSKELLAFLVDRRGSAVTAKEITSVMWEDFGDDKKNTMHLYKLFGDLRETLDSVGAGEVLIKNKQEYSVDVSKIDCDFYKFLDGDASAEKSFLGEYMIQYSWAEVTAASLEEKEFY